MYDAFSEALRAAALQAAMSSGLPALTAFIRLISASNVQSSVPSTHLFAPVVTADNATRGFVMLGFDWGRAQSPSFPPFPF